MILLIDNYDSFTFNLYQYLGILGQKVVIFRNDKISIKEIQKLDPTAIVLSPGPGGPGQAGICLSLVRELHGIYPILGICLGHQIIAKSFGGMVRKARSIRHGKISTISHNKSHLFEGLPEKINVMRYHSLSVGKSEFPNELMIDAESEDDGEVMAIHHHDFPVYGIQFHPESIGTEFGMQILANFLKEAKRGNRHEGILA
ncbi:anthranilate synthase component II [Bacillus sp. B-jedd]|uniref:anthranilate synthase component II n=1 Tax=Bacillus sp. B-jedd TaxID=1476857 RepID=UPI00051561E5|nr:aminodeoxychorismate/anthranilate synthase component II [Bacillus sp. B-jedd]CEG27502.1 glutamine amidotransferase of anthranilate synthase [Bacillus sp. B-jedd]